jgi:hypothetical protein
MRNILLFSPTKEHNIYQAEKDNVGRFLSYLDRVANSSYTRCKIYT